MQIEPQNRYTLAIEGGGEAGGGTPAAAPAAGAPAVAVQAPAPAGTALAGANWRDAIPEDIRSDPSLQDIKDVGNLAKSFVNAQKMVGADKIALPAKDATPEQWGAFFTRLGRPESAENYDFTFNGVDQSKDDRIMGKFGETAHKLGLSGSQARGIVEWYNEAMQGEMTTLQTEGNADREKVMTDLRGKYGEAADAKIEGARSAIRMFGGEALVEVLEASGMGDNPEMIAAFIRVGEAMSEDTLSPGIQRYATNAFGSTPQEAQTRIAEINKELTALDPMSPRRGDLVEEKIRLADAAHPADATSVAVGRQQ